MIRRVFIAASIGAFAALSVYFIVGMILDINRWNIASSVKYSIVDVGQVYSRMGVSSGTPLPDQIDERIRFNVPDRVVRRSPFLVEVEFYNEYSFYMDGYTRRLKLTTVPELSPRPETSCSDVIEDRFVACVAAREPTKSLETGFRVGAGDHDKLDLILDLRQAAGLLQQKSIVQLTDSEVERINADERTGITVAISGQSISVSKLKPVATVGRYTLDFFNNRLVVAGIPSIGPLGLSYGQEKILELFLSFVAFLLGSGVAWRFASKLGYDSSNSAE